MKVSTVNETHQSWSKESHVEARSKDLRQASRTSFMSQILQLHLPQISHHDDRQPNIRCRPSLHPLRRRINPPAMPRPPRAPRLQRPPTRHPALKGSPNRAIKTAEAPSFTLSYSAQQVSRRSDRGAADEASHGGGAERGRRAASELAESVLRAGAFKGGD